MKFDESKHPRDNDGKFGSINSRDAPKMLKSDMYGQIVQPSIKEQIKANKTLIDKTESIGLTVDYESTLQERVRMVKASLSKTGGIVHREDIGDVQVGNVINEGLKYYRANKSENIATQIAIAAIPKVIEQGVIIDKHEHKGRGYITFTVANKVYVGNKEAVMAVVIKQTNANKYKVHRLLTPNGDNIMLDKDK